MQKQSSTSCSAFIKTINSMITEAIFLACLYLVKMGSENLIEQYELFEDIDVNVQDCSWIIFASLIFLRLLYVFLVWVSSPSYSSSTDVNVGDQVRKEIKSLTYWGILKYGMQLSIVEISTLASIFVFKLIIDFLGDPMAYTDAQAHMLFASFAILRLITIINLC